MPRKICRQLSVTHEIWPLKEPFHISRGVRTETHVITVDIEYDGMHGRGEAVPYARYGESTDSVMAQIEAVSDSIKQGISSEDLQALLPAGAARNAVDCALWDMKARCAGTQVRELLHLPLAKDIKTAVTIGIGSVEKMSEKASLYKNFPLLKVKLDGQDIREKITSIRKQAPEPRIIIDPNESWTMDHLSDLDNFLDHMNISLLEQPLAAGQDEGLMDFKGKIPICADESCHTRKDLDLLLGKYQVINIKLDKTGGLTEAVKLKKQATAMGFDIMVGCMVSTSLAMAPAMLLASGANFVDLDGPILIAKDRQHGLKIVDGVIDGISPELWGG